MFSLKRREAIALVQYKPPSGRGRPRMAWVATEFMADIQEAEEGDE